MVPDGYFDFRDAYKPDLIIGLPQGDFPISGDITVDEMALFSLADAALNKMLFNDVEEGSQEEERLAIDAANRAHDLLLFKIKKRRPDAPDELKLLPAVCFALISQLSENVNATHEIVETLTLGAAAARATAGDGALLEEIGELVDDLESGAPLAQLQASRRSSTSSSETTAGSGTGGETSPGGSSRATAEPQPTPA